jgi:hypothetical protein
MCQCVRSYALTACFVYSFVARMRQSIKRDIKPTAAYYNRYGASRLPINVVILAFRCSDA